MMFATTEEIVAALVDSGVDVDATDQSGNTALHRVAEDGEEVVVQALLKVGVKSGVKNKAGKTPLDLAKAAGHKAVATLLS